MIYYLTFFLDGVTHISELNQSDVFHPNKKGIKIMAKDKNIIILKYFK